MVTELKARDETAADDLLYLCNSFKYGWGATYEMQKEHQLGGGGWGGEGAECVLVAATNAHSQTTTAEESTLSQNSNAQRPLQS
jgi:hypothetical protein